MAVETVSEEHGFWMGNDPDEEMDLDLDEYAEDPSILEDNVDPAFDFAERFANRNFSALRRIEIRGEDRWLRSAIADFEDFDDFGEIYSGGFSY